MLQGVMDDVKIQKKSIFVAMNGEMDNKLALRLEKWYADNARDLPWRHTRDAYLIWVSEIILQQTRVAQGYDYYLRFVERFPDVASLASADDDEVMKYWQGLGYYSRARNMIVAARDVMSRFGGHFPTTYDDIRSLKGVGDYTAAAIASFAYDLPHAVVDGNVYRVLSRLFDVDMPIDTTTGKRYFAHLAHTLLHRDSPGLYNQAIMEFGALQCVPSGCDCSACPLQDMCAAYALKKVDSLPVKQGKVSMKSRYFHYFAILCQGRTWLLKREGNDIWRNLYEFPLIETAEPADWKALTATEQYLKLFDESGTLRVVREPLMLRHVLTHRIIHATFYTVQVDMPPKSLSHIASVPVEEVERYAVSRLTEIYLERCKECE